MKAIVLTLILLSTTIVFGEVLPSQSLYRQNTSWVNSEAQTFKFSELTGTPTVIAMTYTGCQYSCPLTFKKLEAIEKDLKAKGVKNYRMVVASFDFQKDTPAVLQKYMKKHNYDPSRWTIITARSDADVRELAVLLGVRYQKVDNTDFSHSNEINLLDRNGVPALVLKGVSSEHNELVNMMATYEK